MVWAPSTDGDVPGSPHLTSRSTMPTSLRCGTRASVCAGTAGRAVQTGLCRAVPGADASSRPLDMHCVTPTAIAPTANIEHGCVVA